MSDLQRHLSTTEPAETFSRTERLFGSDGMERLRQTRVILFGVGGVGSWCAEALVRTGVGHLTMVDPDIVAYSNINRQCPASTSTVGRHKVEVMRERLLDINPQADIVAMAERFTADDAERFALDSYDYVIDAIDSMADKAALILLACRTRATLLSSMGAALKMDPSRIAVTEFWKVKGCPLAASLRRRFKKAGTFPAKKFKCVYSDELLRNKPTDEADATFNGSLMHATGIFGLTLASLVVRSVYSRGSDKDV